MLGSIWLMASMKLVGITTRWRLLTGQFHCDGCNWTEVASPSNPPTPSAPVGPVGPDSPRRPYQPPSAQTAPVGRISPRRPHHFPSAVSAPVGRIISRRTRRPRRPRQPPSAAIISLRLGLNGRNDCWLCKPIRPATEWDETTNTRSIPNRLNKQSEAIR